jgi:FAD dependent oxidoreductase TIGR03364
MKILIIGGGIIGTTHAYQALKDGHQVMHLERDGAVRSASVRNFGLVWVSGRKSGAELLAAVRARELWSEINQAIPEMIFRGNGSLTLAINEQEVRVMEECLRKEDASIRQWQILDRAETIKLNPAVRGDYLASLWCPLDATVEPDLVLHSFREYLMRQEKYVWRNYVDVVDVRSGSEKVIAVARSGENFEADVAIVCPGADHQSLFKERFDTAPLRRVRLQMMSTEPFDELLTTSIADGDSMRYYPGYSVPALEQLPPQQAVAKKNKMQLLMVQRADGTLTLGDTHEYEEPFEFKMFEKPYSYLHELASNLLGRKLPPISHRWDGIYSQVTDGGICDRRAITENIISVTGPGGRGNTLAPAIAEETMKGFL